jgi:hypothetical protein
MSAMRADSATVGGLYGVAATTRDASARFTPLHRSTSPYKQIPDPQGNFLPGPAFACLCGDSSSAVWKPRYEVT